MRKKTLLIRNNKKGKQIDKFFYDNDEDIILF